MWSAKWDWHSACLIRGSLKLNRQACCFLWHIESQCLNEGQHPLPVRAAARGQTNLLLHGMHIKSSCPPLRAVLLCTGACCFSLELPALQSNILDLVRTQQEQSVRVAEACKAAADARADGADLEHMLAWLTGAHAQEMALHLAFQSEVGWAGGTA